MNRPGLAQVPPFYHAYMNLVAGDDLNALFKEIITVIPSFLVAIPEEQWDFRYAESKWSIKEAVQHMTDTERIFSYRALCFSRGETASLPGFDEKAYAATSKAGQRTKESLLNELKAVQHATALLFESFDEEQRNRSGIANNNSVSVRAIGFIAIGHMQHHKNILQQKYLHPHV